MKAIFAAVLPLLALVTPSVAVLEARDIHANLKKRFGVTAHNNTHLDLVGDATFDQLLDHSDPKKGTFKQRFWWNGEHYKKGGPVFLFNPGESAADEMLGYLEEEAIPGLYAETFGGAAIVIEHRYWGKSNPFKNHTAETLQYLNLPNSMKDMTNFAMNAKLEFCEAGDCNANDVPWVLIGGSYAGALAAWTSQKEPGVFAAYHASSAVVHAISDFWTYFAPIEAALPRNCSVDVRSVVAHVDKTFASNDQAAITALKTKFGLQSLNGADFADILANPLSEWQGDQKEVYDFCEYLETLGGTAKPSPTGQGLAKALDAYASWIIKTNSKCGKGGSSCNTYDTRIAWNTPTEIDDHRPWQWMLCNEPFGWWQVGPEKSDGTNIVSSQMRGEHYSRRCNLMFPETNKVKTGAAQGFTEKHHVMWSKGWDAPYKNVIFVDGEFDPWRSATVSSKFRSNGYANTTTAPLFIVKGGVHCPELWINKNNKYKWDIVQASIRQMGVWLKEWKKPSA